MPVGEVSLRRGGGIASCKSRENLTLPTHFYSSRLNRPGRALAPIMPDYTTLPGDLAALDSQGMGEGMPIWRRFAVIIRSRRIDITEVMRGYDNVDRGFFQQGQFRRALCLSLIHI